MRRAIVKLAKGIGTVLLFAAVVVMLAPVAIPPFLDRIYYRGPASSHFDGERFFNPDGEDTSRVPGGRGGRAAFFWRWVTGSDERPAWPEHVPVRPSKPAPRVEGERMVATWVGHATLLVQTQGLNILTDPTWNERAGPFGRLGPSRVAAPGIRFEDLPKIDVVLVSHNHYDHLDRPTLKRLWERDRPLIVTSLGNDSIIAAGGAKAVAADWGKRIAVRPGIDVIVTRNHHWGSRWFTDRNRALEMGTGSHISPVGAVEAFQRLGASTGIGMHWGTFRLSFEGYDTPPKMLDALVRCTGISGRFVATRIGQAVEISPYAPPAPARQPLAECANTREVLALP